MRGAAVEVGARGPRDELPFALSPKPLPLKYGSPLEIGWTRTISVGSRLNSPSAIARLRRSIPPRTFVSPARRTGQRLLPDALQFFGRLAETVIQQPEAVRSARGFPQFRNTLLRANQSKGWDAELRSYSDSFAMLAWPPATRPHGVEALAAILFPAAGGTLSPISPRPG
jgi:hypothetical protein